MIIFGLDLGYTATLPEWAYTIVGVIAAILTSILYRRAARGKRYQSEENKKYPDRYKPEMIIATTFVGERIISLFIHGLIIFMGLASMVTAPVDPDKAVTTLGILLAGILITINLALTFLAAWLIRQDGRVDDALDAEQGKPDHRGDK